MPKNIDDNDHKDIESLFNDHKSFLCLMADISSVSISEVGWSRVCSYLSPTTKFMIRDPSMMVPNLITNTEITMSTFIVYKKRGEAHIYVHYDFPVYEGAACHEFLLRGASLNLHQSIDMPAVSHKMVFCPNDENKVSGVILVSSNTADTLYMRVIDILMGFKSTH